MSRLRALAVLVLLLSYGAVGARQPAVRASMPLPVPAADIASTLGLSSADPSHLVLDVVHLVHDSPPRQDAEDARHLAALLAALSGTKGPTSDTVPLPLDPSVWRETILRAKVADADLFRAIVSDRRTALLYVGLASLDDETLAWLGPDRETLQFLLKRAGTFAAFGRSLRIRANRIEVPGGADQEPVWKSIVGADPAEPASFARKLFGNQRAHVAYFYDTVAHLDPARQRFALGTALPPPVRLDRARALFDAFVRGQSDWLPGERPFMRLPADPALIIGLLRATPDGRLQEPAARQLWEQVFRGDDTAEVPLAVPESDQPPSSPETTAADAAWIVSRIARLPGPVAQRRLQTVLFAQRVFGKSADGPALVTALRGYMAYPSLMLTLERMGLAGADVYARAASAARALGDVRNEQARSNATLQFQAALGILARIAGTGALEPARAEAAAGALFALSPSPERGFEDRIGAWLRDELLGDLPGALDESTSPIEDAVLAAMAGLGRERPAPPIIEWEGVRYRVDAARAELLRLRRVRARQGPPTIDEALAARQPDRLLTDALASVLYAAYLGDPEGSSLDGGNVAMRHTLGSAPWRVPVEEFGARGGWRLTGSILGLEAGLRRLAMRRLDSSVMPPEPRLSSNERQSAYLAAALLDYTKLTDAARDEIAAAIARGRARVEALGDDRPAIERIAADAGMSEWRREALAWTAAHDRGRLLAQFSLVDLLWIGAPRPALLPQLDPWGSSPFVLTGCLCLEMPRPRPWEEIAGRPAVGLLATRGADAGLAVAEALASLQVPAPVAAGVIPFALQDVIDRTQPGYLDDWPAFGRAALDLPRERVEDFIAALTAGGALLPIETKSDRP